MSNARRPQGKTTTTTKPKPRRWLWVCGFVLIVVGLIVSLTIHGSGRAKGSPFGPQAASSAAPASAPPGIPTANPSAQANPGDGAIDGQSTLPSATLRQIQQAVDIFVDAYYTRRYTDPPNANFERVQRLITPGFVGPLPQIETPSSNAGQSFYDYRTESIASVNDIAYDLATRNRVTVTVTIMQTTSYEGSPTNWYTFTRTLTLTRSQASWLVAVLAEGVYGT